MTPAEAFAEVIRVGLPNLGYTVFTNHMPATPDNAIVIRELPGGRLEGRSMSSGKTSEHPAVYLLVRGIDSTARDVIQQISNLVDTIYWSTLSDGQRLQNITKSNTIGFIGQENQTRRYLYSQTYRLTLEPE